MGNQVYRVLQPIEAVGAIPGDYLLFRPGHKWPFTLHRDLFLADLNVMKPSENVEAVNGRLTRIPPHRPRLEVWSDIQD